MHISLLVLAALASVPMAKADPVDEIACVPGTEFEMNVKLGNKAFKIPEDKKMLAQANAPFHLDVAYMWAFDIVDHGKLQIRGDHEPSGPSCHYTGGNYDGHAVPITAHFDLGSVHFQCGEHGELWSSRLSCQTKSGQPFTGADLKSILGKDAKTTMSDENLKNYRESVAKARRNADEARRIADTKAALKAGDSQLADTIRDNCKILVRQVVDEQGLKAKLAEIERIRSHNAPIASARIKAIREKLAPSREAILEAFKMADSKDYDERQKGWEKIHSATDSVVNEIEEELKKTYRSRDGRYGDDGREPDDHPYDQWDVQVSGPYYANDPRRLTIEVCRSVESKPVGSSKFCLRVPFDSDEEPKGDIDLPFNPNSGKIAFPVDEDKVARGLFEHSFYGVGDKGHQAEELCPIVLSDKDYGKIARSSIEEDSSAKASGGDKDTKSATDSKWGVLPVK